MTSKATTVEQYLNELPEDKKAAVTKLRNTVKKNLPKGFVEVIGYGMIGYVIPHSKYPNGYHCNPKDPLPFMNIASQKNFVAIYTMGLYSFPDTLKWFTAEYEKLNIGKLDMGKSCVRFKKVDKIPFALIGELCSKITPDQWIERYEAVLNRTAK